MRGPLNVRYVCHVLYSCLMGVHVTCLQQLHATHVHFVLATLYLVMLHHVQTFPQCSFTAF